MPPLTHTLARAACRRFPLLSGRGTLVQAPPLRWLRFAEERLATELPDGRPIVVFPNDFIGRSVYFFGDVDPKIARTLARLLGPGDTLLDVGANVGLVSLQGLDLVGATGRVIAVEPQPACCAALRETIALGGLTNLELHAVALSDRDGRLTLQLPDPTNLGSASLEPGGEEGPTVEVRDGSAFLDSLGLAGEYAVKIDVEGHEAAVVRGLAAYFRRHPPRGVVFEAHAHRYRGEDFFAGEAYGTLVGLGFRIYEIPKAFVSLRPREVVPGGQPPRATDFVAVRPDAVDRILEDV